MQLALASIDVRGMASEVRDILGVIQGHLDATMSPERIALRALGMDPRMGSTKVAYCDEAFDIWSNQLKRYPGDYRILHHMAIMHHARAMDLEAGKEPGQANTDWETALRYWHQLHCLDAFWEHLVELACKGTKRDAVDKLRQELPQLLLQLHYDIALDDDTRKNRKHRAKYHITLAQEAPFAEEVGACVRRDSYTRFIQSVPHEVWQSDELDPAVIKKGTDQIEAYLEFDPGCLPALEDALRLQVRLLRARHTALEAAGAEKTERTKLLGLLKQDADYWHKYFSQLIQITGQMDDDVRHKLVLWFRIMGQAHRALEKMEEVIGFYEKALAACGQDDSERQLCSSELVEAMAYNAREMAHEGKSGARAYCDRVRARPELTVSAIALLANAYTLLEDFDVAEELCHRGLAIEPDLSDLDMMQNIDRGRKRLTEMLQNVAAARTRHDLHELMQEAQRHLGNGAHEDALAALNLAIEADATEAAAYFLRAQALLGLHRPADAITDVQKVKSLLGNKPGSNEFLEMVQKLEDAATQALTMLREFGGEKALRLRQQAIQAFNGDQHQEAIRLLKSALLESKTGGHPAGAPKIKSELSMVLTNAAIDIVNKAQTEAMEAQKNPFGAQNIDWGAFGGTRFDVSNILGRINPLEKLKLRLKEAEGMLLEATQLDPASKRASQTRTQVRDLLNQLP